MKFFEKENKEESQKSKIMRFRASYTLHQEEFDSPSWFHAVSEANMKTSKNIEDKLLRLEIIGEYDLVYKPFSKSTV